MDRPSQHLLRYFDLILPQTIVSDPNAREIWSNVSEPSVGVKLLDPGMRLLKSLSLAWKAFFVFSGLSMGLVAIREEPRISVGLGDASALLLIAIGLSAWDPFELWLEVRSTGKIAERLLGIADMLKSAGAPPPPLSRFDLVKLLRWLGMSWGWTVLFVGFGGCTRACFASTRPLDLLKAVGLTAAWVLFVGGIQELPKGAADMLEIRLRQKVGATRNLDPTEAAQALSKMVLGVAMLAVLAWWTSHLYKTDPVQADRIASARDSTCADFIGFRGNQKLSFAYGYSEGVQAELEKDEPDILVPPSDARHPMWWVLPEGLLQSSYPYVEFAQKLDRYCQIVDNRRQKLLDAFLSIAYRNTGRPKFGISFDKSRTDPWKKILGGEESSVSCSAYSAGPQQTRQAIVDGYYLGTQALKVRLGEGQVGSTIAWPSASSPQAVRIEVDKNCEKEKGAKLRDALFVVTVEMAVINR